MRRPSFHASAFALGVGLLTLTLGCSVKSPQIEAAPAQHYVLPQDYAQARQGFKTQLLQRGPAPQEWQGFRTPLAATRVMYRSGDLELSAFVSGVPKDGKKHPAVLFLHGGFAYAEEDWDMTVHLREAGFVVMMPVLRGENGQPGTFSFFYDEVDDVLAAADALARLPGVDASRLYVSGHSVGGTLALLAAQSSRVFRAATSLSASPDQRGFIEGREAIVPFAPNAREIDMRSPGAFATSFKCPTRLYFGSEESYYGEKSLELAQRARKAGLDVEALSIPGDHFSSVPEGIQQSIAFFQAN
jgi:dipeptidyl aminopeptidase/acylaminoacyl peptidase